MENKIHIEETEVSEKKSSTSWTNTQKLAFRIFGIYFLLLCIPAYSAFYDHLINLKWDRITYHDFQAVVAFWPPQLVLIESEEGVFGFLNYINLIIVLFISIVLGLVWSFFDKKSTNYNNLYYWVHVIVRYRLAFGMIGWGLKKAFPMQMVYPTLGMLNTPFIDMAEKKLYWSHVGVSFWYTVFLGFAEIVPGLLLLNRKTASLGGLLAAVVCFNIVLANHAFDAGVAVPAAYFTLLGIFVVWKDLFKINDLLVGNKDVQLNRYYPTYDTTFKRKAQAFAKYGLIFVFGPLAAIFWGYGFFNGNNYNIPSTPGINQLTGYYKVNEFKLNEDIIPFNPFDTVRWQDATFEKWSSLSFKTNRTAYVDRMIGYSPLRVKGNKKNTKLNQVNTQDSDSLFKRKKNRDLGVTRWEVGGMAGNRSYFFYEPEDKSSILELQNKNKNHSFEKMKLVYSLNENGNVILEGVNQYQDSIRVSLVKLDKKYPLVEGRSSIVQNY